MRWSWFRINIADAFGNPTPNALAPSAVDVVIRCCAARGEQSGFGGAATFLFLVAGRESGKESGGGVIVSLG